MLAAKLEAGAEKAKAEAKAEGVPESTGADGRMSYPKPSSRRPPVERDVVKDIINSPVAKDLMRTAAREIFRGVFGTGRR